MSTNTNASDFSHCSVLLEETVSALCVKPDGVYVDLTLGGGGHSEKIAEKLTSGRLICVDADTTAIEASKLRLSRFGGKITFVHSFNDEIDSVLDSLGIEYLDGAVADLGVSSYQLDNADRGFSYMHDAPLDMRMDGSAPLTAYNVVNGKTEEELKRILYIYGEEEFAPRIAAAICRKREESAIKTTAELSDIIKSAIPAKARVGGHHPAKRSFQAIRIAVNGELERLPVMLTKVIDRLAPGGIFAVISFHSLEDRIVKNTFADAARGCTCPPSFPVCVCGNKEKVKIITKKPILPGEAELEINPRSRSAKLRVCRKI
ncbi:MAG: 16S rRNA (cytosine(1402)-N(4))-methyltransferase RsmH [Clostridia bacterium]|nr:16S rRNA (cytosine(1402)-N(4))-methyltransferase RsmH [Clostridia bacterium]